jgi:hypothetical protein
MWLRASSRLNISIKMYKTTDLVVLYGSTTSYILLKEEHRLRVFENRVLWKIFGSKKDQMTLGSRKYYVEIYLQCVLFIR